MQLDHVLVDGTKTRGKRTKCTSHCLTFIEENRNRFFFVVTEPFTTFRFLVT